MHACYQMICFSMFMYQFIESIHEFRLCFMNHSALNSFLNQKRIHSKYSETFLSNTKLPMSVSLKT